MLDIVLVIILVCVMIALWGWFLCETRKEAKRPTYDVEEIREFKDKMLRAGPGVYGDIVITKEFHDQLKRNSE